MSNEPLSLPVSGTIGLGSFPAGSTAGDVFQWDGTQWQIVANDNTNPLILDGVIPPGMPALDAGVLYKQMGSDGLWWRTDNLPAIDLTQAVITNPHAPVALGLFVVNPNVAPAVGQSYLTIAAAVAAAQAYVPVGAEKAVVAITTGTYTENVTISSQIHVIGLSDGVNQSTNDCNVIVIGTWTLNAPCTIKNIELRRTDLLPKVVLGAGWVAAGNRATFENCLINTGGAGAIGISWLQAYGGGKRLNLNNTILLGGITTLAVDLGGTNTCSLRNSRGGGGIYNISSTALTAMQIADSSISGSINITSVCITQTLILSLINTGNISPPAPTPAITCSGTNCTLRLTGCTLAAPLTSTYAIDLAGSTACRLEHSGLAFVANTLSTINVAADSLVYDVAANYIPEFLDLYIDPAGNDSQDGLSAARPLRTVQAALYLAQKIQARSQVFIHAAAGTYIHDPSITSYDTPTVQSKIPTVIQGQMDVPVLAAQLLSSYDNATRLDHTNTKFSVMYGPNPGRVGTTDDYLGYFIKFHAGAQQVLRERTWLICGTNPALDSFQLNSSVNTDFTLIGGGPSTIRLPLTGGTPAGYFNGWNVQIHNGVGVGQTRQILAYDNITGKATLTAPWSVPPISGSGVTLYPNVLPTDTYDVVKPATRFLYQSTTTFNMRNVYALTFDQIDLCFINPVSYATINSTPTVCNFEGFVTMISCWITQDSYTANYFSTVNTVRGLIGFGTNLINNSVLLSTATNPVIAGGVFAQGVRITVSAGSTASINNCLFSKYRPGAILSPLITMFVVSTGGRAAISDLITARTQMSADSSMSSGGLIIIDDIATLLANNTAQAGSSSSLTLAVADLQADNYYTAAVLYILSGTGAGQITSIRSYTNATNQITFNTVLAIAPNATSVYTISNSLATAFSMQNSSVAELNTLIIRDSRRSGISNALDLQDTCNCRVNRLIVPPCIGTSISVTENSYLSVDVNFKIEGTLMASSNAVPAIRVQQNSTLRLTSTGVSFGPSTISIPVIGNAIIVQDNSSLIVAGVGTGASCSLQITSVPVQTLAAIVISGNSNIRGSNIGGGANFGLGIQLQKASTADLTTSGGSAVFFQDLDVTKQIKVGLNNTSDFPTAIAGNVLNDSDNSTIIGFLSQYAQAKNDEFTATLTSAAFRGEGLKLVCPGPQDHYAPALIFGTPLLIGGTAQAGSLINTIVLDAADTNPVNFYQGMTINLNGGTGAGQDRIVQSYVSGTRVATMTANWDFIPDATTIYTISGPLRSIAQAGGVSTITLAASDTQPDHYYNNSKVYLTSGTGSGRLRTIISYNSVTKIATVDSAWGVAPDVTTGYYISGNRRRQATSATNTSLVLHTDDRKADDYYTGMNLTIIGGTGVGQTRRVTAYVRATNTVTIRPTWVTLPDATSIYMISDKETGTLQGGGTVSNALLQGNTLNLSELDIQVPVPGSNIAVFSGTGSGQLRTVSSYNPAGHSVTLSNDWDTAPSPTATYAVVPIGAATPPRAVTSHNTMNLASADAQPDGSYVGHYIFTTGVTGNNQLRRITAYRGLPINVAWVDTRWTSIPTQNTGYIIASPAEVVTNMVAAIGANAATTFDLDVADVGVLPGMIVNIISGPNSAQARIISAVAGQTVTVSQPFTTLLTTSSMYFIHKQVVPSVAPLSAAVVSATASNIILDPTASAVNNFYNNTVIFIRSGRGYGQYRTIIAYIGATRNAAISAWTIIPDATSTYVIVQFAPSLQFASNGSTEHTTINLNAADVAADGTYDNRMIMVTAGAIKGTSRPILRYFGAPLNTVIVGGVGLGSLVADGSTIYTIVNTPVETAAAGVMGATTITLNPGSAIPNYYVGRRIWIMTGSGRQVRTINSYNSGTGVATVTAWTAPIPLAGDIYYISDWQCQGAGIGPSAEQNYYMRYMIRILSGTGIGQIRYCSSYIALTGSFQVAVNFSPAPDATSVYEITNVATDPVQFATADELTLSARDIAGNDEYRRYVVEITEGQGVGQSRTIVSHDATLDTIVVEPIWLITPDATSVYRIYAAERESSNLQVISSLGSGLVTSVDSLLGKEFPVGTRVVASLSQGCDAHPRISNL